MKSLKDSERDEIIQRLNSKETLASLAREFGVSTRSISRIKERHGECPVDEPCASGHSEEPKRKKQRNLELKEKEEIIYQLGAGKALEDLATNYDVSVMTVRRIRDSKEKILAKIDRVKASGGSLAKKMVHDHGSLLDKAMSIWFKQEVSQNNLLPGTVVQEQAKLLNTELGGPEDFKASNGWLYNFKAKYRIRNLSVKGEKMSSDREATEKFVSNFNQFLHDNMYTSDQVYNADEMGLYWRGLPTRSQVSAKTRHHISDQESNEDRVTVMLCANADGTHKIPLFLIGKPGQSRCFQNEPMERVAVNYATQTNAWMNRKIFLKWYTNLFLPEVRKKHSHTTESSRKVLLLLDNAPAHPSLEELNAIDNTSQVIYPPHNVPSIVQPMYQGVIEKVRMMYRKNLSKDMVSEKDAESVSQRLQNSTLKDAYYIMNNAWYSVTAENIENAWTRMFKNEISIENLEASHIDVIETLNILQRVPGYEQSSYDQTKAWLEADHNECGWKPLNVQEIAKRTLDGSISSDEDEACEDYKDESINATEHFASLPLEKTPPDASEALEGATTLFNFMELHQEFTTDDLLYVNRLRDRLLSLL